MLSLSVDTRNAAVHPGAPKRSTNLEVLRGIGRDLLSRFLCAFSEELAAREITIPEPNVADTEFYTQVGKIFSSAETLPISMSEMLSAIGVMVASARPSSLSARSPPPKSRYSLQKGLGVWRLTFNGQDTEIKHERGMFYVAYLLLNPPENPIHAFDLIAKIPEMYRKQLGLAPLIDAATGKTTTIQSNARIQERSLALDDAQTMRTLLRKERQLEAILDSDDASEPEKAEALRELEAITKFQQENNSRTRDSAQNASDTVRIAIWRLQRHLLRATDIRGQPHAVLCPFALHLANFILFPSARHASGCFTYEPPPGIFWASH